jgi:hypothetical protein
MPLILPKKQPSNNSSKRDHSQLSTHAKDVKAVNESGKSGTAVKPTIICGERAPGASSKNVDQDGLPRSRYTRRNAQKRRLKGARMKLHVPGPALQQNR